MIWILLTSTMKKNVWLLRYEKEYLAPSLAYLGCCLAKADVRFKHHMDEEIPEK